MNLLLTVAFIVILQGCYAPPVTQNKESGHDSEEKSLEQYMEYHRYLKEVVNALESDPDFRKKLESADENDIKTGKIAEELEFVSHHVRTKLDELKRIELERLKELMDKKRKLTDNKINDDDDPMHHHLDRNNPHTFEIEDLKKLIAKTTADLAEADKLRREEFKEYEMQKEFERQNKLNHTQGEEREKLEKQYKENEDKHKKHEKLHEPGHKAQLEEVWEKQDQMQQDFDPKTFFLLHDLDGNGYWDQDEVKALFIKELDKMYQQGAPEDDMRERIEEMERMRESVFQEIDVNRDGVIDYDEFLSQTKSPSFTEDNGWQGLDERLPYSDEEWQRFMERRNYEMAHGRQMPPQGYHPQGYPPQGHPQGYQPQGYPPQGHPQGYPPQGYPPQYYQGQPPQGQFHPNQIPQGQYHPNVVQQQQQYQQAQYQQQQYPPQQVQQQINQQVNQQQPPQQINQQPPQQINQQPPQQINQQPPQQINQQPPQQVNQQPPQQLNQQPPQQLNQQPPQQINQQPQQAPANNQQPNAIPQVKTV